MAETSTTGNDRPDDLETAIEDGADKVEDAAEKVEEAAEAASDDAAEVAEEATERVEDAAEHAETVSEQISEDVPQEVDATLEEVTEQTPDALAEDQGSGGSSFASTALKLLIMILVIFGLALWLVPLAAPLLPTAVAERIMPFQNTMDDRLAAIEAKVNESEGVTSDDVASLRTEIDALTKRLATAEAEAERARTDATEARTAADASATAAKAATTSETVVSDAEQAARYAAQAADTATTAATEAGKVAAQATRDTAALTRQLENLEARISTMSNELGALGEGLAASPGTGGGATPELAAAFSALKARVDGLGKQLESGNDFLTRDEGDRFATQDDLRSARTALSADLKTEMAKLPAPGTIMTAKDLDALRGDLGGQIMDLATRVETAEKGATEAAAAAATASEASTSAVGQVQTAIRGASVRAAVAALTSRMTNGLPFDGALAEIEQVTGTAPPEALASAAGGVATTPALLRNFGRAAQAAIGADMRAEAVDGDTLDQVGAEIFSVFTPRPTGEIEGEGTDAVISRIEARLKDGKLADALAEAETLSDPAKEGLGAWLTQLRARVGAEAAAQEYIAALGETQG